MWQVRRSRVSKRARLHTIRGTPESSRCPRHIARIGSLRSDAWHASWPAIPKGSLRKAVPAIVFCIIPPPCNPDLMRMGTRARIHTKTTTGGTFAAEIAAAEARAACPTGRPLGNAAVATRLRFTILMAIHERLEGRLSSERDINHGSFSHSCLPWSIGPCPDRYPGRWLRASSRPRHWRILRITRSIQ